MRQAVLLIHGVGEQRPMDTLRGFVKAVAGDEEFYSKPDRMTESFELRRLQLAGNRNRPVTDFYEVYWAHHMRDTRVRMIVSWLKTLLLRDPREVPAKLLPVYLLTVVGLAGLAALAGLALAGKLSGWLGWWVLGATGLLVVVERSLVRVVHGVIGDAARYLDADPDNIRQRHAIRMEGRRLLTALHESKKYSRIVVIGHSLGSVIGYDVLSHYWQHLDFPDEFATTKQNEAKTFEDDTDELLSEVDEAPGRAVELFQQKQHRTWRELRKIGYPWLVTDFITLGSPLTYATMLMARTAGELGRKIEQYEFPACPPSRARQGSLFFRHHFTTDRGPRTVHVPHHGAPFCCTRWTNLYAPSRWLVAGDVIGGPLAKVFGRGIRDVAVGLSGRRALLAHTKYWDLRAGEGSDEQDRPSPVKALRSALLLDSLRARDPWPPP